MSPRRKGPPPVAYDNGWARVVVDKVPTALGERLSGGLPASVDAAALREVVAEPEYALAFCRLVAIPEVLGEAFPSVTGSGGEAHLEVRDAAVVYVERSRARPLAAAYAAAVAGKPRRVGGREIPRWTRRLLVEAGMVEPPAVRARPLESAAPDSAARVYDSIILLAAVRRLAGDEDPFPLNKRFLAAWSGGVAEETAATAKKILVAARLLEFSHSGDPSRFGKKTSFWRLA